MSCKIPRYLPLNSEQWAKIVGPPKRGLGYCQRVDFYQEDGKKIVMEIALPDGSPVERMAILIHELLHAAAEMLIDAGEIKRQPDEKFITNAAGPLLFALGGAGLIVGVDLKALLERATTGR